MTTEEIHDILHTLQLDSEGEPTLIYLFYQTPDGRVNNLTISLQSARQRNNRPMTDRQLVELMAKYPDAARGRLLAIERPDQPLSHWLDTAEVCRRLHTTRQSLHRWVQQGFLHPAHLGSRVYYDANEIDAFLRSNQLQPNGRLDRSDTG